MYIDYPFEIELSSGTRTLPIRTSTNDSNEKELYISFDAPRWLEPLFSNEWLNQIFSKDLTVRDIEIKHIMPFSRHFVENFSLERIAEKIKNTEYRLEKPKHYIHEPLRLAPEAPIKSEPVKPSTPEAPIKSKPVKPDIPKLDLPKKAAFSLKFFLWFKKVSPSLAEKVIPSYIMNQKKILDKWKFEVAQRKEVRQKYELEVAQWKEVWQEYELEVAQWKYMWQKYERDMHSWRDKKKHYKRSCAWENNKALYEKERNNDLLKCLSLKADYTTGCKEGILSFFSLVINHSPFPKSFKKEFKLHYDETNKILLIEFELPNIETISIVKTRNDRMVDVTQTEKKKFQEFILYALPIRIMWELVKLDKKNALNSIAFNGYVNFNDKATGLPKNACILSLHAKKQQIENILIENIDPKECFKSLKGLSAGKIIEYIPVVPMLQFDRDDRRFVAGRNILCDLSQDENLAAMNWEDFEHLIRELFEKEFANGETEVRITQASRDRGVDAVIYDPDPIRGGKFIIQAKRYTSTVDVSAIRDLYGTILNEGANRGIIVTTSSYGGDSYEFAKDKPITLLDGSNLLHLLQKHGYSFRIDLKEARLSTS